jgi:hypothetical protein
VIDWDPVAKHVAADHHSVARSLIMTVTAQLDRDITPTNEDYDLVRQTIERISLDFRAQPSLERSPRISMLRRESFRRPSAVGPG